jgi:hypothetical protein
VLLVNKKTEVRRQKTEDTSQKSEVRRVRLYKVSGEFIVLEDSIFDTGKQPDFEEFIVEESAKSFVDLSVWKKAHSLVLKIYLLTKEFPKE